MQTELDIVADVSNRLEKSEIPFMLTGSMAMNFYATPRMTRDIDIVLALAPTDVTEFVSTFSPDYVVSLEVVREAIRHQAMFNLIHSESVIKVDFVVRKNSTFRRMEFERRRQVKINGFKTWIVSLEDLILSKLVWAQDSHSEYQLKDVRNLLLAGPDATYIEYWAQELNVSRLLEECRGE